MCITVEHLDNHYPEPDAPETPEDKLTTYLATLAGISYRLTKVRFEIQHCKASIILHHLKFPISSDFLDQENGPE
jgi:hypothetical protein